MRWQRQGGLGLLGGTNEVDWGCQLVTKSTWFGGGGGGVVVKAAMVVGFWVCEGEWEKERERELEINSVWVGFWASKVNEIDTMNERDTVNERDTEIHCFWQKRRGTKMKSPKKKKRREDLGRGRELEGL